MDDSIVGIVPAAGRARRLGDLSISKALLPVYLDPTDSERAPHPACHCLLRQMLRDGIRTAIVVTLEEATDVREALGSGGAPLPDLRHISLAASHSPVFSVAAATRTVPEANVAFGFPDMLWRADAPFERLVSRLALGASVTIGLFPTSPDYPTAEVETDDAGRVVRFHDPTPASGRPTWALAAWTPAVSRALERIADHPPDPAAPELDLTAALVRLLAEGFRIDAVRISEEPFFDIGSPERLEAALRRAAG
ncbi:MAG: hypothetical protein MJB57_03460 [Gemmatimonadetes bacterium]|nr:hypothetical protein [Gemmatimonadota bacterium]